MRGRPDRGMSGCPGVVVPQRDPMDQVRQAPASGTFLRLNAFLESGEVSGHLSANLPPNNERY